MDDFISLSEKYNIPILEDCAQAHGTEYKGMKVGSIGKTGAFSFFATKHMTTGEGGMITTDDARVSEISRIIRNHGMIDRDHHVRLGFNNRMNEIEAAMGFVQLKKLDNLNEKRIANSEYLVQNLLKIPWAYIPVHQKGVKHTYFWCPLMIDESKKDKDIKELKQHLRKNGIGFRERYQEPLYKQIILKKLGLDYSEIYLQHSESVAGRIIGLPNHPGLVKSDLDRILDVIGSF